MKFQKVGPDKENTHVLIFDKGDEFMSELTNFARNSKLAGSHLTAIGAFQDGPWRPHPRGATIEVSLAESP